MMVVKKQKLDLIDTIFIGILLVVFGGIVLQAPISVGFGTLFSSFDLIIKTWKEILLVFAAILLFVVLFRKHQLSLLRSPLVLLITAYAVLHVALLPLFWTNATSALAGLIIDLRYLLFFVLVFIAIQLYPHLRRTFIAVFVAGALIVVTFALLQFFVLPPDILKYIGYNQSTIMPYLTVDQNESFIRINSTLRGPNPLGAYAGIILALLAAYAVRGNHKQFKRPMFVVTLLGIGGIVSVWASYSRSALIAAIVAVGLVLLIAFARHLKRWMWVVLVIGVFVVGGAVTLAKNTEFVSNVVLHENIQDRNDVNSNEGHVESLRDGVNRMVHQPLGGGVGSTGSASLYTEDPIVIENQYLFIAHEVGWIGLGIFLYIFWKVLRTVWQRRRDWLALGVFASGVGLTLIGLLLPVWVDDTVSIIWWGLAAVVIGGVYDRSINKASKRTT